MRFPTLFFFSQELAPPPSMTLQIDISKESTEEIELPPLDDKDVVWQVRAFERHLVILTQNRIVISTGQGKWHILDKAPGMMDVVQAADQWLYFSHISGDILRMDPLTFEITHAFAPTQLAVGRKLDADSHMLLQHGPRIFVGRPEGIIDGTPP